MESENPPIIVSRWRCDTNLLFFFTAQIHSVGNVNFHNRDSFVHKYRNHFFSPEVRETHPLRSHRYIVPSFAQGRRPQRLCTLPGAHKLPLTYKGKLWSPDFGGNSSGHSDAPWSSEVLGERAGRKPALTSHICLLKCSQGFLCHIPPSRVEGGWYARNKALMSHPGLLKLRQGIYFHTTFKSRREGRIQASTHPTPSPTVL